MGIIRPRVPMTTKKIPNERYIIFINLLLEGMTLILIFFIELNTEYLRLFQNS